MLQETSSGHLVFPLTKNLTENKEEVITTLLAIKKQKQFKMRDLKKLHCAFGHPTTEKLSSLMKDAGVQQKKISKTLDVIQQNCMVCKRYKRKESKPKTALPKSNNVNEVISMDLKPVSDIVNDSSDKRNILYVMDEFSRFTAAGVIKNKEPETVANKVLDIWCLGGMGYPSKMIFFDNGTEFKGGFMEEIANKIGVKVRRTPSYSPWSNGAIERRHGAIDATIRKFLEDDSKMKLEDALKHSVWARNLEIGRLGHSPYQVVFGRSPFLPGVSEGTIVTDECPTRENSVRNHFANQEKARVELRKADASVRLKEALKSRMQPSSNETYEHGDWILFLNKEDKWDGPAMVVTKESQTLHILHNGIMKKTAVSKQESWR